jgi:hypothetical protein
MEVDKTAGTSDLLIATSPSPTTITYGGTLKVTTLAGTITASSTFKMFSASNYTGAFVALSPTIPGGGLMWNTNTLTTDGILRITSTINTNSTNITLIVTNNSVDLTWPLDHTGWLLQSQTNPPGAGLRTNWIDIIGSNNTNHFRIPIGATNGSVFFRMVLRP